MIIRSGEQFNKVFVGNELQVTCLACSVCTANAVMKFSYLNILSNTLIENRLDQSQVSLVYSLFKNTKHLFTYYGFVTMMPIDRLCTSKKVYSHHHLIILCVWVVMRQKYEWKGWTFYFIWSTLMLICMPVLNEGSKLYCDSL